MEYFVEMDTNEVREILSENIDKVLAEEKMFDQAKLNGWCDAIIQGVMVDLAGLQKHYKYAVTCEIHQRDGAGLFTHCSCHFNPDTEIVTAFRWENNQMYCIVSVFAIALF